MKNSITICTFREADKASTAAIADIYNQYVGKTTMDLQKKSADYFQAFISHKGKRENLYIAEVESVVVGYGIIKQYSDREGYQFAAETSTYLDTAFTGKGIGSKLQQHIIGQAKALGLKHLVAKIWATNLRSIQFHELHGYTVVGTQKQIGFVDGEWKDVTIMECIIT
jgi:phosphinothricin acetyltransferase